MPHLCTVTSAEDMLLVSLDPSSLLGSMYVCLFFARQSRLCLVYAFRASSAVASVARHGLTLTTIVVAEEVALVSASSGPSLAEGGIASFDACVLGMESTICDIAVLNRSRQHPLSKNAPRTYLALDSHHQLCCRSCRAGTSTLVPPRRSLHQYMSGCWRRRRARRRYIPCPLSL